MRFIDLSEAEIKKALIDGKISVCVVGLGRIGLPTAVLFANGGAAVIGVDIDDRVVNDVSSAICQFHDEPGLATLLKAMIKNGALKANSDISFGVSQSDMIIICVPTPVNESKVPDTRAIIDACEQISKTLRKGSLVVVESTVSPGTVEDIVLPIIEKNSGMTAGTDFGVVSCPERASPGESLQKMNSVPRVIGGIDNKSTRVADTIYKHCLGSKTVVVSNPKTANAVKLTENIFRDVNIALMNEFAILYEKLGIDAIEVINACATKWNFIPHFPGAGVGGPCLPANAYYIIDEGLKVGYIPYLVRMAREINDRMPDHVVTLVTEALNAIGKVVSKSKIAFLGVSYKSNIHDLQMTPFKRIYEDLKRMGACIDIHDPLFEGETVFGIPISTLQDAVTNADCIIVGTPHSEFKKMDLSELSKFCNKPAALVDTFNIVDQVKAQKLGFSYLGVGRRPSSKVSKTDTFR